LSARKIIVLSNESNEAFLKLAAEMEELFQPVDDIERGFVTQAASARWRMLRASIIETGLFDLQMADDMDELDKMYPGGEPDEGIRLAVAFKKMTADRTLDTVGRYQARLMREYERAIAGLDRVRAERKARERAAIEKLQNEPKPAPDCGAGPRPAEASQAVLEKLQNEPKPISTTPAQEPKQQNEPKDSPVRPSEAPKLAA
jgi:hypothetical protein